MTDLAQRGPLGPKQPKPEKKPKGMRKQSRKKAEYRASERGKVALQYMAAVKSLPCCICGFGLSDAHHVIAERYGTRKASDFDTIPLCKLHHQDGPDAIHQNKQAWLLKHGPDYSYIAPTREKLKAMYPDYYEKWKRFFTS